MAVFLGLATALSYGLSDFLGGLVSRRVHFAIVGLIGYGTAMLSLLAVVLFTPQPAPTPDALLWGAVSGIGGGIGTLALYRGLARGRMGVVAPLSGVGTAALPLLVGVALGDRPSALAWLGIAAAFPAIFLVSTSSEATDGGPETPADTGGTSRLASGVADGLLAGVGFALLLVALGLAGDEAGLWPVAASDVTGFAVIGVAVALLMRGLDAGRLGRRAFGQSAVVGLTGATAVVLYFWSTQAGLLSIVAVLTSLYPAATVVLAALLLSEPIGRRQAVGLALAAGAVVLIVVG